MVAVCSRGFLVRLHRDAFSSLMLAPLGNGD